MGFTSETARAAAKKRKGTKRKKTQLWEQLGEFLVNDGADIFMRNLQRQMKSDDPREQMMAMNMYKDTLEFFKPKLSRSEVKNEGEQTLKIEHKEVK